MSLSREQRKKLQDALIAAFPSKASLEQMLSFELDKNLNAIAGGDSLKDIVFKLITTAEAENWVENLINAARKSNPGNQLLKDILYYPKHEQTLKENLECKYKKEYVQGIVITGGNVSMSANRTINMGDGNYNERIEGDYIQQQGSFGIGVNKGKVKAEKIAGTINETQDEVLQKIESLRKQIETLDNQAVRSEGLEHLDDVKTEVQSSKPKQSRLKASLNALWNVVKDTALVANAVTSLAANFGAQLPPLP